MHTTKIKANTDQNTNLMMINSSKSYSVGESVSGGWSNRLAGKIWAAPLAFATQLVRPFIHLPGKGGTVGGGGGATLARCVCQAYGLISWYNNISVTSQVDISTTKRCAPNRIY